MAVAVKTTGLTKTYRLLMQSEPVVAVSDLNIEVEEGEVFGFLGPNGAGKTTTIKMLLGLAFPTSGKAWLLDKPAGDIPTKQNIAYLPETPYFYDYMSGSEILDFYGRLFKIPDTQRRAKVDDLLKLVGLYPHRNKPLSQYSKGMLQRVGIAQALLNDPKLLFLDEPTSGLDPIAHAEIHEIILRLRDEGKTVFLSSHQLSDVEMVCSRVAILNRGHLLKMGTLTQLLSAGHVEIRATNISDGCAQKLKCNCTVTSMPDHTMITHSDTIDVSETLDSIRAEKGKIISVLPQRRTLEDLFVEVIKGADSI